MRANKKINIVLGKFAEDAMGFSEARSHLHAVWQYWEESALCVARDRDWGIPGGKRFGSVAGLNGPTGLFGKVI